MKLDLPDTETLLEIGLVASGALLLGGLAVLALGRAAGEGERDRRQGAAPPGRGAVPAHRHHNVAANPAR